MSYTGLPGKLKELYVKVVGVSSKLNILVIIAATVITTAQHIYTSLSVMIKQ